MYLINEYYIRTTCNAEGAWSHPLPSCLAPCIVPEVTNGEVQGYSVGDKVEHGEIMAVNCSHNYETVGKTNPLKCNNGTWSQVPKCWPARCKRIPSPPSNGMIVVPDTSHGSMGLYQCKDGFMLSGVNTTVCQYGEWSGKTPTCEETHCPFPGYLSHGKVLLVGNMGLYDYRPYVKRITNDRQIMFHCDKGYKIKLGNLVNIVLGHNIYQSCSVSPHLARLLAITVGVQETPWEQLVWMAGGALTLYQPVREKIIQLSSKNFFFLFSIAYIPHFPKNF